jgi:threonine/homoserine/homoserine lactone efflux protein
MSIASAAPANTVMLAFGHAIFTVFHASAFYFGAAYLLITIPAHLIYTAVALAKQDRSRRVQIHH